MQLTCNDAPGVTRVTNITDDKSHFKFQWWYANGTTYKDLAWAYYASSVSHGKLTVNTHGQPTRAMATMHRQNGTLVRVKAACS